MTAPISRPPQAHSIPSTSSSPMLSIMSTDVLLAHQSTPSLPTMDATNTLTPRSRTLLVKQAQKLQRILGETPHIELAIDWISSGPTRPSAAVLAKRRNTMAISLPTPLPSPPLLSANGQSLAPKPSMPTITLTSVPRPPSPPLSPSSPSFTSPAFFLPGTEDSDSEVDPETIERRRMRARLAKIQRWTGENVPVSLLASTRRSADERRIPHEVVHARSKSVLMPSPVKTPTEQTMDRLVVELSPQVPLMDDASIVADPVDSAANVPTCPARGPHRRDSEDDAQEIRRTAKLSKFFGVPATQLPPPLPSAEEITAKHCRATTEPAAEVEVHLPRSRSFSSTSGGHSHSLSLSSTSQVARTMTPFSEYSYDSDDSDKGVEVRVKRGKARVGRRKKSGVQGRLGEMEQEDFAVMMDKLRRMK
ncbi:hypothetical protein CALVIDRAFT_542369 [Calocera viscosa TUFC12733]|uniref:Uncharacterized protein n=1 Tax=Calocera viscosa (strain TUFC12733) TaxID=1330018 RepID=A0A167GQY1_CALVF|nr:hypothetical protein CALVIDRAFT_542369 [Calocera viscosa TUFC12733]